jgi:flagellar basal-body rod protein FlgB
VVITPISDLTTKTLQAALHGVEVARQAHQDNIANMETPGYLAQTVSFQDALGKALDDGSPESAAISTARSTAATNMNGNNVSADGEMVAFAENALTNQLLTEALSAKYRLLRAAIV